MGYTHYWKLGRDLTDDEVRRIAEFVPVLAGHAAAAGVPTHWEVNGHDDYFFSLNGIGDDGHETFGLSKKATDFAFCKTARKPYDSVVVALLCWAHQCCPAFTWTSDGDDEPDYKDAGEALLKQAEQ